MPSELYHQGGIPIEFQELSKYLKIPPAPPLTPHIPPNPTTSIQIPKLKATFLELFSLHLRTQNAIKIDPESFQNVSKNESEVSIAELDLSMTSQAKSQLLHSKWPQKHIIIPASTPNRN